VPRRGRFTFDISPALHLGQRCCTGNVVAPHAAQRLPISWGSSSGQVEISGASAFWVVDTPPTLIGNGILV
jgi:hypothetical protein